MILNIKNLDTTQRQPINTQTDAVIYFIQQMDTEMLSDILDCNYSYENMSKDKFLRLLDVAFNKLKDEGNTHLLSKEGRCNGKNCNYLCNGYSFVGNFTDSHIDLLIEQEEGKVKDIHECAIFKCNDGLYQKGTLITLDDWIF